MQLLARLVATAAPLALAASAVQADVVISSNATLNVSCSAGVCSPTAANAVLNVTDLENMLASGNVDVTTTGSGVQANNIVVGDALSWSATSTLTLDAYQSVSINKAIAVQGQGGLALTADDGGTNGALAFGHKGNVTFANLSSNLTINATVYTLVNTIQSLASAIAANPSGTFALASTYDASQDGTYTTVPVPTAFTGTFEGLGNAIANLSIDDTTEEEVGLFAELDGSGILRDISIPTVSITANGSCAAPLVSESYGIIVNAFASGSVSDTGRSCAGGLVGSLNGIEGNGIVILSHASTNVSGDEVAGLVAQTMGGTIAQSFATGNATSTGFGAGGFVSDDIGGTIENCYSTGESRIPNSYRGPVGGFVSGSNQSGEIYYSYSSGRVKGAQNRGGYRGGFVGGTSETTFDDDFWDTDESGVTNLHKGAGNVKNEPGIAGLATQQLESGLPPGFDPSIWTEKKTVNDGLPYLLANPPE